mgnify:CR=1 FL=1
MDKSKTSKTITINKNLHNEIKDYCRNNGLIMGKFIEGLLCTNFKKLQGQSYEGNLRS